MMFSFWSSLMKHVTSTYSAISPRTKVRDSNIIMTCEKRRMNTYYFCQIVCETVVLYSKDSSDGMFVLYLLDTTSTYVVPLMMLEANILSFISLEWHGVVECCTRQLLYYDCVKCMAVLLLKENTCTLLYIVLIGMICISFCDTVCQ